MLQTTILFLAAVSNVVWCISRCTAEQVGEKGVAVGIDHIDELVQLSIDNVNKSPDTAKLLKSGQLQLVVGDGRQGYEKFAPYDAIHVGAAAPEIPKAVSELAMDCALIATVSVLALHFNSGAVQQCLVLNIELNWIYLQANLWLWMA